MKIAVMGCGNMGSAVISGLLKKYGSDISIIAWDKSESALNRLDKTVSPVSPDKWMQDSLDVIVLAVKPQDIASSLSVFNNADTSKTLWVSIAAGVKIKTLEELLGKSAKICRVMPNTPAIIGEAISAYALNENCGDNDSKISEYILSALGLVTAVSEKMMDAVTGLSGSGPAYVFLFIESLIEGGVTAGLPYDVAKECAIQTVIGSARLAQSSDKSPAELKSQVMSPNGTTVRGLLALEKNGFKYGIIDAVTGATKRSVELGKD